MSVETIGLPKLKIAFEAAAQAVANRSKRGYVGLIVRDTQALGLHKLSSDTMIPPELGEANKAHIKTAFEGSDRGRPSLVYLAVIPPNGEQSADAPGCGHKIAGEDEVREMLDEVLGPEGAEAPEPDVPPETAALEGGLKLLSSVSLDYLAPPPDVTGGELEALDAWVKGQRAAYRPVKLVRPLTGAGSDDMGIIDWDEPGLEVMGKAAAAAGYCARIAGILAGIPMSMSATYASLPEVTAVTERGEAEQAAAIDAGRLILIHDGQKAKIARAVNSLVTIPPKGRSDWRFIKIVEGMDLITYYLRTTIEDNYVGRYANTYDNKQLLVAEVLEYLQYLERAGVLNPGQSFCQIDYEAQLRYLRSQGVETADLTEQQVLEYQTDSWVFLRCGGRQVNAMEDFEVLFNNL